ncbi:MAG: response regulator [Desulfotalea sp.]
MPEETDSSISQAIVSQLEDEVLALRKENIALKKKAFENLIAGQEKECCKQLATNKQAGKLRRKFMEQAEHEIRTSLNGVLNGLDVLSEIITDDEVSEYIGMTSSETLRLHHKLLQIFDFSKLETCSLDFGSEDFNLKQCLDSDLYDLSFDAIGRDIEFSCFISPDVPINLRGDGRRFKQIIAGLVGNRVRHTSDQGAVAINVNCEVNAKPGQVLLRVTVSDTGTTLPAHLSEAINDFLSLPFVLGSFQPLAIDTLSLDLVCAMQMIRLMGGSVRVEPCNMGNLFSFSLPFDSTRKVEEVLVRKPDFFADLSGKRILIAEDDTVNRVLISKVLEQQGADVVAVADGEAAVKAVKGGYFDIILMDIQMPLLDGFAACEQIRKLTWPKNNSKIIALTAVADREACFYSRLDDYLAKPIDRKQLLSLIGKHLGKSAVVALDDIEQENEVVTYLLGKGWQVSTAITAQQALCEAALNRFDVFFLGSDLPSFNGKSVAQTIRELDNFVGQKSLLVAVGTDHLDHDCFDFTLPKVDLTDFEDIISKVWS